MKKIKSLTGTILVLLLCLMQLPFLVSCKEDMAPENYYTFTGEYMYDYLKNREDFSKFKEVVDRAELGNFLNARGNYTLLVPTNEGVDKFLNDKGYAAIADIPVAYCDTLVKVHLMQNSYSYLDLTFDKLGTSIISELGFPLLFEPTDSVDENNMPVSTINRGASFVFELRDDSVENGIVHPIDYMLAPNVEKAESFIEYAFPDCKIYNAALLQTGLMELLDRDYLDRDYEAVRNEHEPHRRIYSGHCYYDIKIPDNRYYGHTAFLVKDETLYEKYGDQYGFSPENTMEDNLKALYQLARDRYSDERSKEIFGIPQAYYNDTILGSRDVISTYYTDKHNVLNMFIRYHVLDRLLTGQDKFINLYGTDTHYLNPTEWMSTLLEHSAIKIEKADEMITVKETAANPPVPQKGRYYLNHAYETLVGGKHVPGALISKPDTINYTQSLAIYYLDDVIAFDKDMRETVMNTRIRIDFMTLWPELTTNNIRMNGKALRGDETTTDRNTQFNGKGINYYLPDGYLKDVSFNDDGTTFFLMHRHIDYWNWGGDEVNFIGKDYDVTFNLPAVPPGEYELRLGCAPMDNDTQTRGVAQFYVDGIPQGIPKDLREVGNYASVGGVYPSDSKLRGEELEANIKLLKNNGYYRGPMSIFCGGGDSASPPNQNPNNGTSFIDIPNTMRMKIADVKIEPNKTHKVRVRSVLDVSESVFMLDYLELVPLSICGIGGTGEDYY